MKLSIPLLFPIVAAVSNASNDFDEYDRELFPFFGRHGGGGMRGGPGGPSFGPPPVPDFELDCTGLIVSCTPRRPGATFDEGSGARVCIQHPEDAEKSMTICVPKEDDSDMLMVFSDKDECGCCGSECPQSCTDADACSCTGTKRDGAEFTGWTMSVTRTGWFGNEVTMSMCVPAEKSIDAKLRGAECVKTTCD